MIKTGIILKISSYTFTNLNICLFSNKKYRAQSAIAKRLGLCVSNVKNVTIWGNHSSTQFPDVFNATVESSNSSKSVYDSINDSQWLEGDFIKVRNYVKLNHYY